MQKKMKLMTQLVHKSDDEYSKTITNIFSFLFDLTEYIETTTHFII